MVPLVTLREVPLVLAIQEHKTISKHCVASPGVGLHLGRGAAKSSTEGEGKEPAVSRVAAVRSEEVQLCNLSKHDCHVMMPSHSEGEVRRRCPSGWLRWRWSRRVGRRSPKPLLLSLSPSGLAHLSLIFHNVLRSPRHTLCRDLTSGASERKHL